MWSTGINPITGIIPACQDHFDSDNFSRVKAPIDHYQITKGSPAKSRAYPKRGPAIPAVGSLRGVHKSPVPSYSDIETENTIHDPADYEIIIKAEITPGMDVLLNGILIASAPENKHQVTGKSKKLTQPERARFCRGVIWWLMNDETCLKDKLQEIGYSTPSPVIIPAIPVTIPEICIESITGSVYPGPGIIEEYPVNYDIEMDNLGSLLNEELEDLYIREYDILDQSLNPEPAEEIIRAFEPSPVDVIRSWSIPQLRITIQECVLA